MMRLRWVLREIAVTWLLCQAATLALAPTIVWFGAADELFECTCAHGDHAICPMHHKPAPGSKVCVMTSPDDSGLAVFSWLLNAGLVPEPTEMLLREHRPVARPLDLQTGSLRPAPPDPPPPRA